MKSVNRVNSLLLNEGISFLNREIVRYPIRGSSLYVDSRHLEVTSNEQCVNFYSIFKICKINFFYSVHGKELPIMFETKLEVIKGNIHGINVVFFHYKAKLFYTMGRTSGRGIEFLSNQ